MNSHRPYLVYVEDDENDVLFLQRAFRQAGVDVTWEILSDGASARRCLEAGVCEGADLLILDLNLPLLTGFELLAWWRHHAPQSLVPVAILTSSDNERDQVRARQLGASHYLLKPTTPDGYLAVVTPLAALLQP